MASFYRSTLQALDAADVRVGIDRANPFDLPDAHRPFADDTEHTVYDPASVNRYWQVLSQVNLVLEEFAARYSGKASPYTTPGTPSTSPTPGSVSAGSTSRHRPTR